jgi:hypothetical protein
MGENPGMTKKEVRDKNKEIARMTTERLARRLFAAFLSVQLGHASVDRTLKNYPQKKLGKFWLNLAEQLPRAVVDGMPSLRKPKFLTPNSGKIQ